MLRITNIAPQHKIDRNNQVEISHYLVDFKIRKSIKGETFRLSGQMSLHTDTLDISAIRGKILYYLKNILLD